VVAGGQERREQKTTDSDGRRAKARTKIAKKEPKNFAQKTTNP